jgi:hypothetical protein
LDRLICYRRDGRVAIGTLLSALVMVGGEFLARPLGRHLPGRVSTFGQFAAAVVVVVIFVLAIVLKDNRRKQKGHKLSSCVKRPLDLLVRTHRILCYMTGGVVCPSPTMIQ